MLPQAKLLPLFVALVLGGASVVVGGNATVTETPSSTVDSELLAIDELFEKTSQAVRQRIMERLLPVLNEVLYDPKLSTKCAGALLKVGTALRTNEMWVLQMLDSIGRPPAGIMSGRLADYGAYDQCLAMRHPQMAFQGKYCLLNFKAQRLTPRVFKASNKYMDHFNLKFTGNISCAMESEVIKILPVFVLGSCIPSSCRKEDLQFILDTVVSKYKIRIEVNACETQEPVPLERRQIAIICIYSLWILFLLIGTAYDFFQNRKVRSEHACSTGAQDQGTLSRIVLAFSLRRGVLKLVQMPKWGEYHSELGFVHGMRVLSTTWIVLGHTKVVKDLHDTEWLVFIKRVQQDIFFSLQVNAFMAVGSFLAITGFLSGYLVVKAPKVKFNGFLLVIIALFRRYVRLVPSMMAVFGFMYMIPLVTSGPAMGQYWPIIDRKCADHWWKILTMTHNYMEGPEDLCMAHYWYISTDFQLAIVSTIILALVTPRWPKVGLGIMATLVAATCIAAGALTYVNRYFPHPLILTTDFSRLTVTLMYVYTKAYVHAPSLFTGLIFGCLAAKAHKLSRKAQVLLWTVSVLFATSSLFGVYSWNIGRQPELLESAIYAGLHRFAWAFGVSWVMYACVTGRGGPVNRMLAFPLFYPLGRLSFAVYLVHFMLLVCNVLLSRERQPQQPFLQMQYHISTVLVSYALATIVYLCVECPFAVLDNLMFGGMKAKYDAEVAASNRQNGPQEPNEAAHVTNVGPNNGAQGVNVHLRDSERQNNLDGCRAKQGSVSHAELCQNQFSASQSRTYQGNMNERCANSSTFICHL
ncbi:unnamed protein product [Ixodes persulcatus]